MQSFLLVLTVLEGLVAALPLNTASMTSTGPATYQTIYADPSGNTNVRTPAGSGNNGPISHQAIGNSSESDTPQFPPAPADVQFPYTATYTADVGKSTARGTVVVYVAPPLAYTNADAVNSAPPAPLETIFADPEGNTNIETAPGSTGSGNMHQEHSNSPKADIPQFPPAPEAVELPYTTTYAADAQKSTEARVVVYINAHD